MAYYDLPINIQDNVQKALKIYWGKEFHIDSRDDYYSDSGMRYGYIAVNEKTREVLVCDCTPDDGDTLITIVRF